MQKTTNYDQFKLIVGNRQYNLAHLKHLEESILKRNMLEVNPIIVNEDYEVIDGQHRLEVAKKHNLPIYYNKVNSHSSLREVQLLNSNLRAWTLNDYLESYIALGNENYKLLKEFIDTYNLPLLVSASLLEGRPLSHNGGKSQSPSFRDGLFKVRKLKPAMLIAEKINLIKPYVEGTVWKDSHFIRALQIAFTKVGSKRLIKKLGNTGIKVHKQLGMKEYLRVLEDIYNHRLREDNKIRFF